MKTEAASERRANILAGLKITYARMLEFKRQKRSEVLVIQEGKIVRMQP